MASSPGSRTLGFIASPPAVSRPCGLPFASVVSTFPAPSGRPKPHETSALMSIPGEELHISDLGLRIRLFAVGRDRSHDLAVDYPDVTQLIWADMLAFIWDRLHTYRQQKTQV